MAKSEFKSVGRIVACDLKSFGPVFRIELLDGYGQRLPYACPVNSEAHAATQFGNARMAALAMALGLDNISDTHELIGLELIVEHDGTAVARLQPIRVVEQRIVEREVDRLGWPHAIAFVAVVYAIIRVVLYVTELLFARTSN